MKRDLLFALACVAFMAITAFVAVFWYELVTATP